MELVKVRCPVCKKIWLTNKYSHNQCPECGIVYSQKYEGNVNGIRLVGIGYNIGIRTSDIEVKE